MFALIKKRNSLWALFVATIALTFSFVLISNHWDMVFLDGISDPEAARQNLAGMTSEQIQVHIWTTAVIDVLYPLAYGSLFAGVALACFRHFGLLLAIPSLIVIPVDILEGVVQLYALLDIGDHLDWKAILTPLKSGLFLFGLAVAVVGWVKWVVLRFKSSE